MKKVEKVKPSLQEEITSLKHAYAGQKGQIALLQKRLKESALLIKDKDSVIIGLHSQVSELEMSLSECKHKLAEKEKRNEALNKRIMDFNKLPWWKRLIRKV